MKNIKKLCISILATVMMSVSVIGITACDGFFGNSNGNGGVNITPEYSSSESTSQEEQKPHEHSWNSYISKPATCEDDGVLTYSCSCGEKKEETIAAKGHTWNGYISKQATCEEEGTFTYSCSCGDSYAEVIAATGHTWSAGYISKQATCEEDGVLTYNCACGDTYTQTIDKLGHNWSNYVSKQATCEENGVRTYACSNCNDSYTEEIEKIGHSWNAGYISQKATCEEDGVRTYTCANCNGSYTEVIEKSWHNWGAGYISKLATCEEDGVRTYTCANCNGSYTEKIEKLGHIWNTGYISQKATCEEDGVRTYTCANCNGSYTEAIEKLGHNLKHHEAQAATCIEHGWYAYDSCEREDCDYTTYVEISANGHTFVKGYCAVEGCGVQQPPEDHVVHEWDAGVVTTAPTCTQKGVTTYTCWCNDTYTESIAVLGHDLERHDSKAATCVEIGWEAYETCKRAGCGYTTYKEIAKNDNHDLKYHEGQTANCSQIGWDAYNTCKRAGCEYTTYVEIAKNDNHDLKYHEGQTANCSQIGWDAYETCNRCSYSTYNEIAKNDNHDLVYHEGKAATCTEIGWNAYNTCSRCSYTTYVEIAKNDNHDLERHDSKAATCVEIGWEAYETCKRTGCGYTTYKEIAKNDNHDLERHAGKTATCTEIGWDAYNTCKRAGCTYSTYKENAKNGNNHDLVYYDGKASTCTEYGWNAYAVCTRCSYTTKKEVSPLGHNILQYNAKEPGCETIGWNAYELCTRCDYTTYQELPAIEHEYKSATCVKCGKIGLYLDSVTVKKSEQLNEETGELYGATFIQAYDVDNIRFVMYQLGTIDDYVVDLITEPQQAQAGVGIASYEFTQLTTESIKTGISNSISTSNTTSVANSSKKTTTWNHDFSVGVTAGFKVEKLASLSATAEFAVSWGGSKEYATSAEISQQVGKEKTEDLQVEKIIQSSEKSVRTLNLEVLQPAWYYAYCLVTDVEMYQVIGYDKFSGEFYTTYLVSSMDSNYMIKAVAAEEAKDFFIKPEEQFALITEINVDLSEAISINFYEGGGHLKGTENSSAQDILIDKNSTIKKLPELERDFYTFLGWYLVPQTIYLPGTFQKVTDTTIFSSDTTLYAWWKRNKVTLSFDSNGGTPVDDETINQGDSFQLPTPTLDFYNFAGWLCDGALYNGGTVITVTKDMNFVAHWTETNSISGVYERTTRLVGEKDFVEDDESTNIDRGIYDIINIKDCLGYDLKTLSDRGYTTVSLKITMHINERMDGYQSIYISKKKSTSKCLWTDANITLTPGYIGEAVYTNTVTLDMMVCSDSDVLYFLYGAWGDVHDDWYNEYLKVEISVSK